MMPPDTDGAGRADALLLDAILGPLASALREVSLPLHILLEAPFGELNENQLEMIAAARASAEEADRVLRQAQRVRSLAGGPRVDRDETTRPIDLCRGALAIASARAAHRAVHVEADLSPALPRVRGDRAYLEEALTMLLGDAAERAPDGGRVTLTAEEDTDCALRLVIRHVGPLLPGALDRMLAARLVESAGAVLVWRHDETRVQWPYARASA
jgi:signal transduction histidine kinase